jgi:hypothetical protein
MSFLDIEKTMFSHLEKALILLRPRDQWGEEVANAVKDRYAWAVRNLQTGNAQKLNLYEIRLENFVFSLNKMHLFDYDTTAFVKQFYLSKLEYTMLLKLEAIRDLTPEEKNFMQAEYSGQLYDLDEKAQEFMRNNESVFNDFSTTKILDMTQLGKECDEGRAQFIFYKQYYLAALNICGRSETTDLHTEMMALEQILRAESLKAEAAMQAKKAAQIFPCCPTPELLGVQINRFPYTNPPKPLCRDRPGQPCQPCQYTVRFPLMDG